MTRQSTVVVLPNWIGDAIMVGPCLRSLSSSRSERNVIYAGQPKILEIFRSCPWVDDFIEWPTSNRTSTASWSPLPRFLRKILDRAQLLKKSGASEVFLLPGSFSSALAAALAGIPERAGYAREGRGFLLTSSIPHPANFRKRHRVLYYLDLVRTLLPEGGTGKTCSSTEIVQDVQSSKETPSKPARPDWPGTDHSVDEDKFFPPLEIHVDRRACEWAESFFAGKESKLVGPIIAVHAGASYGPSKRWPIERFTRAVEVVHDRMGPLNVVLVGGPAEADSAAKLASTLASSGTRVFVAAGVTPGVPELAALLRHCDLLLSNDSGPMHVAAALGLPQVALFTSTSPVFTAPWNERALVLHSGLDCAPCFSRDCRHRGNGAYPCHDAITPEQVAEAVCVQLERFRQ